jgi:hypothetical protein
MSVAIRFAPVRRQLGVAHRVLDILVAQISLQSPRIAAALAAALCVNSHNLPGRDVLSLRSSRLSRRFLPRLGPSQMAGFFLPAED